MDIGKCIGNGLAGAGFGCGAGIVLWVPSCMVVGIAAMAGGESAVESDRQGEAFAGLLIWICIAFGAIVGFSTAYFKELKADRARQEKRLRVEMLELQRDHTEQQSIYSSLVDNVMTSLTLFESMPELLVTAELSLAQAERDFREKAFSPFWQSIETASMTLGTFYATIGDIKHNCRQHSELSTRYRGEPPPFPIRLESVRGMKAGNTVATRLKAIVRKAQRDFQFASIYEQRRTTRHLVAGFTTLTAAVDGMGQRIVSSVDDLSDSISDMSSVMERSLGAIGTQLDSLSESFGESVGALDSGIRSRHDRALQMLDNIQRRRIPFPSKPGDGAY